MIPQSQLLIMTYTRSNLAYKYILTTSQKGVEKTIMIINVMLIATRQKLASLRTTYIDLFINGYELENVSEQMLLGITITNDLKWNKNVDLIM